MRQAIVALVAGVLFGVGLTLSGMTQPQKVISFLDFTGSWDPSLIFVMVGAITVHFCAILFTRKLSTPILAESYSLPLSKSIDRPLIFGSAIFGIGWGLSGYCPGPALTSLLSFQSDVLTFIIAMALGMYAQNYLTNLMKTNEG